MALLADWLSEMTGKRKAGQRWSDRTQTHGHLFDDYLGAALFFRAAIGERR